MSNQESTPSARQLADKALALMDERGILPYPAAYSLWFEYCAGENAELNSTLDQLMARGDSIDESISAKLLAQFSAAHIAPQEMQQLAEKIRVQLTTGVAALGEATADVSSYGNNLLEARVKADNIRSQSDFVDLMRSMMAQTVAMAEKSSAIEGRLQQSIQEVGRLQVEIENLRQEATTDPLTQIANRKLFDVRLAEAVEAAQRHNEPMSLLLIDVDYFKKFNDNYGHLMGDQVLRLLGVTLKYNCKGRDTPARYGGEEFAVILPNTALENAGKLAEALRKQVCESWIMNRRTGKKIAQVTVSIGATGYVAGENPVELLQRCDEALYSAKHGGRNCVVMVAACPLAV